MVYEPLHHKYRPQTFGQLVGQDAIAATLGNALRQGRIAPAYLFSGPRGTGKTSSARILAKSLNCIAQDHPTPEPCGRCETCCSITNGSALDFIEIDAASNTGVDNIRELIERAQFAPVQCRYKVYVIDECHMLSIAAFNALLKTLEEPPARVVFVLATTDPQRVLPTIISRCQRFDYRRIPLEPMLVHLRAIAQAEAIAIEEPALRLVAQVSQGGLRDAQSLLDQLSLLEPPVNAETVWDLVGAVPERDLLALAQAILTEDSAAVLYQARKLMDRGREPLIVLQNLAGFYRDLLIAKTAPDRQDLVAVTPPTWTEMQSLVAGVDQARFLLGQQHLRSAEAQVKNTTQPRLWLEVTLLGLLPSSLVGAGDRESPLSVAPRVRAVPEPAAGSGASPPSPTDRPIPMAPPVSNGPEPGVMPSSAQSAPVPLQSAPPLSIAPAAPLEGVEGVSLDLLWARVIAVLEPLGTRALMQQQGSLLFLDGAVARIGINSRPLFKMAQGRVDNIATAFEKVLQRKVQVSLEVLPDPKPEAPGASPVLTIHQTQVPAPPPVVRDDPSSPALSPGVSTDQATGEAAWVEPQSPPPPEIATDFERAVKTFAQFFNGQVVDLGDDLNWLAEGPLRPSEAGAKQPSHPDKDVPF
ncbi:MAG: DNA polymerase III subunit gamma/tau [Nodosilinea sp.]